MDEKNANSTAKRNFTEFKKAINDIAAESLTVYYGNPKALKKNKSSVRKTPEEIEEIISGGNEEALRTLSRDYFNLSGIYMRSLVYIATLLTYDILITPKLMKANKKEETLDRLKKASNFLDSLNLEKELARIMLIILQDGVYYGFFKDCGNDKYIFQDLDPKYCRTRFKSSNDLPVLEFDLNYFLTIKGKEAITNVDELKLYPKEVVDAYNKYFNKIAKQNQKTGKYYLIDRKKELEENHWLIISEGLGVVFYYKDTKPLFASTIKAIEDLNEYKGLEKSLDEQELKKILFEQIPMNDDGELLFTLDEALELHRAILNMLKNNPDVDVLTTFCDTKMLDVQDKSQANRDNLEKIERSVYNEAGVSKNLFAADGSIALEYSVTNDTALALNMAKIFEPFINTILNKKFSTKNVFFIVTILPITHYNRKEMFDLYLQGAQYGYSKLLAGVASGIKQSNLLDLITLENDYLELSSRMVPLQSSHTTSGKDISKEEGGAPKKTGSDKSDKTRQNEESL